MNDNIQDLSNYLNRGPVRQGNLIGKENPKEYQLTKDEYEFTKEYLNKDFRKYDHLNSLEDIYERGDYERGKKDLDLPKFSKSDVERLRKSLFNESKNELYAGETRDVNVKSSYKKSSSSSSEREYKVQKPDYIIKNSEFLQKSNELLSKITKERSGYKKSESNRDIDIRLVSDYRKALKDSSSGNGDVGFGSRSRDELNVHNFQELQNFGSIRLRTGSLSRSYDDKEPDRLKSEVDKKQGHQQQQKQQQHSQNEKKYSTSEDEGPGNAEGISASAKGFAYLLAGYSSEFLFLSIFLLFYLFGGRDTLDVVRAGTRYPPLHPDKKSNVAELGFSN
ncbi:hypothetical protein RUM43_012358 [Polyplax serrata]|uniref:Uncharacterized protein n=1 Tax=Polyplax serrata TaxID=468196 RepID=A0AAN8S7F0_POLSC